MQRATWVSYRVLLKIAADLQSVRASGVHGRKPKTLHLLLGVGISCVQGLNVEICLEHMSTLAVPRRDRVGSEVGTHSARVVVRGKTGFHEEKGVGGVEEVGGVANVADPAVHRITKVTLRDRCAKAQGLIVLDWKSGVEFFALRGTQIDVLGPDIGVESSGFQVAVGFIEPVAERRQEAVVVHGELDGPQTDLAKIVRANRRSTFLTGLNQNGEQQAR